MTDPIPTPELDKQRVAREEGHSQEIGEFLDWLADQGIALCRFEEGGRVEVKDLAGYVTSREYTPRGFFPTNESITHLLARYFDIDLKKIEAERQAILDQLGNRTYDTS